MELEPGLMALWLGRLVEIQGCQVNGITVVRFVDEGGVARNYNVTSSRSLQLLADKSELGVLDALQQAAAPNLSIVEQLHRMAELWFAAPAAGDMFEDPGNVRVKVSYVTAAGALSTIVEIYSSQFRSWGSSPVSWPTLEAFQDAYRFHDRPGYVLRARCTERPDFASSPLLSPGPK